MLKPTKKNQEQWIKKHLNNGKCPKTEEEWCAVYHRRRGAGVLPDLACYEALNWLADAEPPIKTLAEAWDRCPRGDWLTWTLYHMQPSKTDLPQLEKLLTQTTKMCKTAQCSFYVHSVMVYWLTQSKAYLAVRKYRDAIRCLHYAAEALRTQPSYAKLIRKIFGNPWREK